MHIADNDFFEEYKQLEKLCSEMYSCQNGVSEYIAQMERQSDQGQYRVSSWINDYKMLKHIRWVRNKIAHDSGSYIISEEEDLDFVQDFYSRIFSGSDPLTLLRKAIESENRIQRPQKRPEKNQVQVPSGPHAHTPENKKSRDWVGILVIFGIFSIGVLALILLFLFLNH